MTLWEPRGRAGRARRRQTVALSCSACHSRNYETTKAQEDGSPPLQLKKFCKTCDHHTVHQETR